MKLKDRKDTVTWLHLSDMHMCRPETGWKADRILNKLIEDLTTIGEEFGVSPDMLFFTGDVAYGKLGAGEGESPAHQYRDAAPFFLEICKRMEIPRENLFIVPGNHDVNREKISMLAQAGLMKATPDELDRIIHHKRTDWETMMKKLEDYRQFLRNMGCDHLLQDEQRLVYNLVRDINGVSVGVAGFNSAWSCYADNEKGRIFMGGNWQIENAAAQLSSTHLRIALSHHPFNWLNHLEDARMSEIIKNHFNLFLHGHEHHDGVEETVKGFSRISAGACYGGSAAEMGYNLVHLDIGNAKGSVWLRTYDERGQGWIPRVMFKKTNNSGMVELNGVAAGVRKRMPDAAPLPSVHGPESRGIFGRAKDINTLSTRLAKHPLFFLCGLSGIGKTTLVDEVRRTGRFADLEYIRVPVTHHMKFQDLFAFLAPVLGVKDAEPDISFPRTGDHYDFSPLEALAPGQAKPAFIHLEDAQALFKDFKFREPRVRAFLEALPRYFPGTYVLVESAIYIRDVFTHGQFGDLRVEGLGKDAVAAYFSRPFKDDPEIGWNLGRNERDFVCEWLGDKKSGGAHPQAMLLLANVAAGLKQKPNEVLKGIGKQSVLEQLEKKLFHRLYEHVMEGPEKHMLRLLSLYRDGTPHLHMEALDHRVGVGGVFLRLWQRCLLKADAKQEWYYLHSLLARLTAECIDAKGTEYADDHEAVGKAWQGQLKKGAVEILPNINAADQALYHFSQAGCLEEIFKLEDRLLRKGALPVLNELSISLFKRRKIKDDLKVLELIVKLDPHSHKHHRFLGERIELVKGKGHKEALKHYETSHQLSPDTPAYFTNIGRCLLRSGEAETFVKRVEALEPDRYKKLMDFHNLSLYTRCLDRTGRGDTASALRMEQIKKGATNPALYNDEADSLLKAGKPAEALKVIAKAEQKKCADEHSIAIKSLALQKNGDPAAASAIRIKQIEKGSKNPIFYNDEAHYLLKAGRVDEALTVLAAAAKNKCADHHIIALKATAMVQKGNPDAASAIRREQIEKGIKNPVFYNDEAHHLLKAGRTTEALEVITKAERNKCSDDHIIAVKAAIMEEKGDAAAASAIRMKRITKGTRAPALYNDEARMLLKQKKYVEALAVLDKAAQRKCTDSYTKPIRNSIEKAMTEANTGKAQDTAD